MTGVRVALSVWVMVVLGAAPHASFAGPKSKPDQAAEQSARAHFQRGQELSAAGDYVAAYREFAAGYALTERPLFLFNMAEAARANGDTAKARENYEKFLRLDPKSTLAPTAQDRLNNLDRPALPPVTTSPGEPVKLIPAPPEPGTAPPGTTGTAALTDPAPSTDPERPLWKKWQLWAVVGGVVAGSAIVYAVSRPDDPCGGGCSQINFR